MDKFIEPIDPVGSRESTKVINLENVRANPKARAKIPASPALPAELLARKAGIASTAVWYPNPQKATPTIFP